MSKNLEQSVYFSIRSSRWLILAVSWLHLLAVTACWLAALPTAYKVILSVLVGFSGLYHTRAGKTGMTYLRYTAEQGWDRRDSSGDYLPISIRSSTVITGMLIILHWDSDDTIAGSLVIVKDAMAPNDYRRLLVCLKISGCGQG